MSRKFVRKRNPNAIKAKLEQAHLSFIEATEAPDISSNTSESDPFMKNWLEEFKTLRDNVRSFITETVEKHTTLTQELKKLQSQLPVDESELKNALDSYESFIANLIPSGPENTATEEDTHTVSVSPTPRLGG